MTSQAIAALAFGVACTIAPPAFGANTRILQHQIVVAGNQNVEATSINSHGTIVGNLYAGITDAVSAIEIDGDTVTTLKPPYPNGQVAHPKAIDDAGDIAGWADNGTGDPLLYLSAADGHTRMKYARFLDINANGQRLIVQPIGLVDRRIVFGTEIQGGIAPNVPFYGTPEHYVRVPLFNSYERLNSINRHSVVGGVSFDYRGQFEAFFGSTGHFKMLLPPGAQQSEGGYVNDANEVAGSYTDANGQPHGFTYYGGQYHTFDMPEPATSIAVTAINDAGRVVGTYASASADGRQHAFLYNGQTVTTFGTYSSLDVILLRINNHGEMLIDRALEYSATPQFLSYTATCQGDGC